MNFLAHAYLSFDQPEILVGNMISDFVKGKKQFDYKAGILTGIRLHRAIDGFTDEHPVTSRAKQYFRPVYRLYAGPFVDIVYDHFLANDKNQFLHPDSLALFAEKTYQQLNAQESSLPVDFKVILPYMTSGDWLYNYRYRRGIGRSFSGMVRRAKYISDSETAFAIFENHYIELKNCYEDFFPELKIFAHAHLKLLQQQ